MPLLEFRFLWWLDYQLVVYCLLRFGLESEYWLDVEEYLLLLSLFLFLGLCTRVLVLDGKWDLAYLLLPLIFVCLFFLESFSCNSSSVFFLSIGVGCFTFCWSWCKNVLLFQGCHGPMDLGIALRV